MTDYILKVQNVTKKFGALSASNDLTFSVQKGEVHAIIGPNGAGKTTVINQLAGEFYPDRGEIIFDGVDITSMPIYKRAHLGLTRSYQITSIFNEMTVLDNIALALQPHTGHSFSFWKRAYSDSEVQRTVEEGLNRVGLFERKHLLAKYLSHGEKKQLEVGMALMGNPKLLLLDEPMAGMGPGGTVEMAKLIRKLSGDITILLVEHDMDVVFSLADTITAMVYGKAVVSGDAAQIKANRTVREAYLGDGE